MEEINDKKEEINDKNLYFKKYIKQNEIKLYRQEDLIDQENIDNLICPICFCILNEPKCCSDKKNSHSFCKNCINECLKNNNKCPMCKLIFENKINNKIKDELDKKQFKCKFKNEGWNVL